MLKGTLRGLLVGARFDDIVAIAGERNRVLGLLVSLTYDRDAVVAWRAVEALGRAAARVAERNPDVVRDHLRRLLWLLSEESGGVCWRAPEAMAEIVSRAPDRFADYVPIVVHLICEMAEEDLSHFRVGMLWAIGRLGSLAVPHVADVAPVMVACLDHADPQVRGTALWALARVGQRDVVLRSAHLRDDEGPVERYDHGEVTQTTVGALLKAIA